MRTGGWALDKRGLMAYGEDRYHLLGRIDGRAYIVVYTLRGPAVRIISARKANAKEVADYEHNARQD